MFKNTDKFLTLKNMLILLFVGLFSKNISATEIHSLEDIMNAAQDYVLNNMEKPDEDFEIVVGKLDRRLRLRKCNSQLEAYNPGYPARQGLTTVGVRCNDNKPWSLYVPVTIKEFKKVAILSRANTRNTVLTNTDIEFIRMNVNRLSSGYFEKPEEIVGMILSQHLTKGAILNKHHVKKQMAVNRGQMVTLIAKNDVVEVRMEGEALSNGAIGEKIRVKNLRSKRIIEGTILDKRLINVNL